VGAIGTDRVADKGLERKMGEVLSAKGKEMSEIKSNIAALSTFPHFSLQTLICNSISPYCAHPGFSPVARPRRYLFILPSCIHARIFGVSSGGTPRPVPTTRYPGIDGFIPPGLSMSSPLGR
jgi:hypothetical protein